MINLPQISLDWDLVAEPDFHEAAKELLRDNALFSLKQSMKHPNSDWAESRVSLGDDFNKIYYFDIGNTTRKIISTLNEVTSSILRVEPQRFDYGDSFFDDIRETLMKRFGNVACSLAYIDTSFEKNAELLITTKQALKIANFRFSSQYSVAYPPPS